MMSRFVMVAARMTRRLALVIFMAAVLCASAASTLTDSPPPAQVLSNYENYWAANLARDCGYSQPLPSDPSISLWLFCDTAVNGANSQLQWRWLAQINGSTGAEGPSAPAGIWSELTSGKVPCAIEADTFCRAIFGHPELSTSSRLLVSYFDPAAIPQYNPAAGPEGHIIVAAFPW
jgi:hypothetical protein